MSAFPPQPLLPLQCSLTPLPADLTRLFFCFLCPHELPGLGLVCRHWHGLLQPSPEEEASSPLAALPWDYRRWFAENPQVGLAVRWVGMYSSDDTLVLRVPLGISLRRILLWARLAHIPKTNIIKMEVSLKYRGKGDGAMHRVVREEILAEVSLGAILQELEAQLGGEGTDGLKSQPLPGNFTASRAITVSVLHDFGPEERKEFPPETLVSDDVFSEARPFEVLDKEWKEWSRGRVADPNCGSAVWLLASCPRPPRKHWFLVMLSGRRFFIGGEFPAHCTLVASIQRAFSMCPSLNFTMTYGAPTAVPEEKAELPLCKLHEWLKSMPSRPRPFYRGLELRLKEIYRPSE